MSAAFFGRQNSSARFDRRSRGAEEEAGAMEQGEGRNGAAARGDTAPDRGGRPGDELAVKEEKLKRMPSIRPKQLQALLAAEQEDAVSTSDGTDEGGDSSSSSVECDDDDVQGGKLRAPLLKETSFRQPGGGGGGKYGNTLSVGAGNGGTHSSSSAATTASSRTRGGDHSSKRRHLTLGSADSEEMVVLRRPRRASERHRANPKRQRHTLFGAAASLANGGTASTNGNLRQPSGHGGQPLNFDIEAVKLAHARQAWHNGGGGIEQQPPAVRPGGAPHPHQVHSRVVHVHRRPSISSEGSLSDCEELGLTHTGLEDDARHRDSR